jgi:DNA-directed RNA polymerase specialized sigma24 family protein
MKHSEETTDSGSAGPVRFPATLWTIVLEARNAAPERAQEALGELCVHYREAILGYFRLKCRHQQDAEDLTSGFIAHLLERRRLGSFEPGSCPRFRAYLSVALRNFFGDWLDKRNAGKRGDGKPDESIELRLESGREGSADDPQLKRAVDLGIARTVHERVMAALKEKASDPRRFEVLREFIPFEHGKETHEQAAQRLELSSLALRQAILRLRRDYVQQFRAALAPSVRNVRRELEDETSELLKLLPEAVALATHQLSSSP